MNVAQRRAETDAKTAALGVLNEFLEEGDLDETLQTIGEMPELPPAELIKRALILGIERHPNDRERISRLLSALHPVFEGRGYEDAFTMVLERLPDLALDVPEAADYLGLFLARALYDEALAPSFVKDAPVASPQARHALNLAYNMYHVPAERARLENIWGAAAVVSVDALKAAVNSALEEFLESWDDRAATKAVKELGSPSFGGRIVQQALTKALERDSVEARTRVVALLAEWWRGGLLGDAHVRDGVAWLHAALPDLVLDTPHAKVSFPTLLGALKAVGMPVESQAPTK